MPRGSTFLLSDAAKKTKATVVEYFSDPEEAMRQVPPRGGRSCLSRWGETQHSVFANAVLPGRQCCEESAEGVSPKAAR